LVGYSIYVYMSLRLCKTDYVLVLRLDKEYQEEIKDKTNREVLTDLRD